MEAIFSVLAQELDEASVVWALDDPVAAHVLVTARALMRPTCIGRS